MTCIVAVTDGESAVMAADRQGTAAGIKREAQTKIFRRENLLIGISGSYRVAQIIEHHWQPQPIDSMEDAVGKVVPVWRALLKEHGALLVTESVENMAHNAQVLLLTKAGVFLVEQQFNVMVSHNGYQVTGAGWEVALGALYATEGLPARARAEQALKAAAQHVTTVGSSFDFHELL